jgi:endoglucanase
MLWCQPLEFHIETIANLGFNSIRIPLSEDLIMADWDTTYPDQGIVNPSYPEAGMKSIEILDRFFDLVEEKNITVIFDIHRLNSDSQAAKPFIENSIYTFVRFMDAWVRILTRYENRRSLVGVDVFNEFQGDDWGDWKNLAEITINHIEGVFPSRFIYYIEGSRWGGDLHGAKDNPIRLQGHVMDRVFMSIHKYWFSDEANVYDRELLRESWEYSFGFLNDRVMVGEWGYMSEDPKQKQWAEWFVEWLQEKDIRNTYFWSYNYDSGDTKGVLLDDCYTVNSDKVDLLHRLWGTE